MAINENNIEKLRNRFVSALKWIGLNPHIDNESLQSLVEKCRARRHSEVTYLLSNCAQDLINLSSEKTGTNYSKLINSLAELDKCFKITSPTEIDNICVVLK